MWKSFWFSLEKCKLYKKLRVSTWASKIRNNCHKAKKRGPLSIAETEYQVKFYIKRDQRKSENWKNFE